MHIIFLFVVGLLLLHLLLEEFKMIVRHSEVDISLAVGAGIKSSFHKVLLHRSARTILIRVEQEQALRQLTVVQALSLEQVGHHLLVVASLSEVAHASSVVVLLALAAKLMLEGEALDILEKFLLECCCWNVVVGCEEGE